MGRFILLSFAFLALGFYELSGGADFDPEATRADIVQDRRARELARIAALPAGQQPAVMDRMAAASTPQQTRSESEATPISLNLSSFEAATERKNPVATPLYTRGNSLDGLADAEKLTVPEVSREPAPARSVVFPGRTLSSAFSSSTGTGASDTAPAPRSDGADIRVVTGTLVNMRSGPGTDFEVIDQLEQSTRVEVLRDDGEGWVELRALESGSTGWIAAFLLSSG